MHELLFLHMHREREDYTREAFRTKAEYLIPNIAWDLERGYTVV